MNFAAKLIKKARETYGIHELQTTFPYYLNKRIEDGWNTIATYFRNI